MLQRFAPLRIVGAVGVLAWLLAATSAEDPSAVLSPSQVEAARQGMVEALERVVSAAAATLDELQVPPWIYQSQRKVAFVTVTNTKMFTNITMHRLGSIRLSYPPAVDPLLDNMANFTLSMIIDAPYLTGNAEHKVNDVGPTGHVNTTISQVQLEAEGTAWLGKESICQLEIRSVQDTVVGDVDATVEGANVLNAVLAKEVSDAVRTGQVSWIQSLLPAVRSALQKEAEKLQRLCPVGVGLAKAPA